MLVMIVESFSFSRSTLEGRHDINIQHEFWVYIKGLCLAKDFGL